jgi:hypothetical protein
MPWFERVEGLEHPSMDLELGQHEFDGFQMPPSLVKMT